MKAIKGGDKLGIGESLNEKKETAQYTDGGSEKITVTVDNMRKVNIDNVISHHRKYPFNINIPISVQYDFIVRRKTSFFAETGFDLYLYKSLWRKKIHVIPVFSDLFLGHRLSISRNFDLITKLKIPGISLLTDGFGTFNFIEKGIEFLLAYRIPMTGKARIKSIPCLPF